jgi:hypothetical protein
MTYLMCKRPHFIKNVSRHVLQFSARSLLEYYVVCCSMRRVITSSYLPVLDGTLLIPIRNTQEIEIEAPVSNE